MIRVRATDPRPCPKCGKMYRSAHTLRTHLEDKHTVCPGYRCVLCGTVAKSRNSLHSHMSRQHRGISTKDLPVMPMPSQFDPELASRLLAKAGVKVSPAELRARASPTAPRRSDMRLEPPRGSAPSEVDSCGGDDPEDLTVPLSLRYGSPIQNTVITKVSGNSNSSTNSKNSTTTAITAKSLDTMHGNREPNMAPLPHGGHHPGNTTSAIAGSAILDTYLQLIAENSGLTAIGLAPEHAVAVAHAAKMRMMEKHGSRSLEDYPMIGRDEGRGSGVVHEDRHEHDRHSGLVDEAESSGADDDEFSENEESEPIKE